MKEKGVIGNQVTEKPNAALCSLSSGSVFGRKLLAGMRTCKYLCLDPISWAGDLSVILEMWFKNTNKHFYKIIVSCLCSSAGSRGNSDHYPSWGKLILLRVCKHALKVSGFEALP